MSTPIIVHAADTVHQYLRALSEISSGKVPDLAGLILKYGRVYFVNSLSWPGGGELGLCYQNAYDLARDDKHLTYCEGYAISDCGTVLQHGWVVDKQGYVIDPTWYNGQQYFGVAFKWRAVTKSAVKTKHYGMVLDSLIDNPDAADLVMEVPRYRKK